MSAWLVGSTLPWLRAVSSVARLPGVRVMLRRRIPEGRPVYLKFRRLRRLSSSSMSLIAVYYTVSYFSL